MSQSVADQDGELSTILDRLAAQRHTVNNDVAACLDVVTQPRRLHDRQANAERFHGRYVASLAQLASYSRDELHAALNETTARLERGWDMDGDAVDDLFDRLVLHVEVLTDALAGPDVARAEHRERLARIGA